jgi:hypothetical protein
MFNTKDYFFQNTETLQLFTKIIQTKSIFKVIKMPSWKAWFKSPADLVIIREEVQVL